MSDFLVQQGNINAKDNTRLHYKRFYTAQHISPKGIVLLVHGFGEHSGRYSHLIEKLTAKGLVVYAYDHRGHGLSKGQRGHINAWSDYRNDVLTLLEKINLQEPDLPVVIFGHSMGSLITADFILHYPSKTKGAILSAAPMQPSGAAKPHLVFLAKILSKIKGNIALNLGLDVKAISQDPTVVAAYTADPLNHGKASARWGTEMLKTIDWVKAQAPQINIPLFILHGASDRISLAAGSKALFEAIGSPDKTLKIYENAYHEVHNDLKQDEMSNDVADWIVKRMV